MDREITPMSEQQVTGLQHIATLCGSCSCGCPTIALDAAAPEEQQVVITDDFAGVVRMSRDQFQILVEMAKAGTLSF